MTKKIINMNDIKNRKIETIEWAKVGTKIDKDGVMTTYPLKVWQNLECVLKKHNIELKLNDITHEIESNVKFKSREGRLTDIHTLAIEEGLKWTRDDINVFMNRIAEEYNYNPFTDMLLANENDLSVKENQLLIQELFNCLKIDCNDEDREYYFTIFFKWLLNVVKMAFNSFDNNFSSQGVLVLQGDQGLKKTTFCRNLIPDRALFKSDESLDPSNKDSIMTNTKYILVEWGELDSTLKSEQASLKRFITAESDEYRAPYGRCTEKYPRKTSYIGTVNKKDFLKDETGSRRFWIIPLLKIDIEKQKKIDMPKLWGAVYSVWKTGEIKEYLEDDELNALKKINSNFNYENDTSIILKDNIDWSMPIEQWKMYKPTEIANALGLHEVKKIEIELTRMGYEKKPRKRNGKTVRSFLIPDLGNE